MQLRSATNAAAPAVAPAALPLPARLEAAEAQLVDERRRHEETQSELREARAALRELAASLPAAEEMVGQSKAAQERMREELDAANAEAARLRDHVLGLKAELRDARAQRTPHATPSAGPRDTSPLVTERFSVTTKEHLRQLEEGGVSPSKEARTKMMGAAETWMDATGAHAERLEEAAEAPPPAEEEEPNPLQKMMGAAVEWMSKVGVAPAAAAESSPEQTGGRDAEAGDDDDDDVSSSDVSAAASSLSPAGRDKMGKAAAMWVESTGAYVRPRTGVIHTPHGTALVSGERARLLRWSDQRRQLVDICCDLRDQLVLEGHFGVWKERLYLRRLRLQAHSHAEQPLLVLQSLEAQRRRLTQLLGSAHREVRWHRMWQSNFILRKQQLLLWAGRTLQYCWLAWAHHIRRVKLEREVRQRARLAHAPPRAHAHAPPRPDRPAPTLTPAHPRSPSPQARDELHQLSYSLRVASASAASLASPASLLPGGADGALGLETDAARYELGGRQARARAWLGWRLYVSERIAGREARAAVRVASARHQEATRNGGDAARNGAEAAASAKLMAEAAAAGMEEGDATLEAEVAEVERAAALRGALGSLAAHAAERRIEEAHEDDRRALLDSLWKVVASGMMDSNLAGPSDEEAADEWARLEGRATADDDEEEAPTFGALRRKLAEAEATQRVLPDEQLRRAIAIAASLADAVDARAARR